MPSIIEENTEKPVVDAAIPEPYKMSIYTRRAVGGRVVGAVIL
jgi:hypothetical protein